jgi:hypothetical protein
MPANTPRLALPYPLPTDQVAAGATDIRALAEAVDPILAAAVQPFDHTSATTLDFGTLTVPLAQGETKSVGFGYRYAYAVSPIVLVSTYVDGDTGGNTNPGIPSASAWLHSVGPAIAYVAVRNGSNGPITVYVYYLTIGPTIGGRLADDPGLLDDAPAAKPA